MLARRRQERGARDSSVYAVVVSSTHDARDVKGDTISNGREMGFVREHSGMW